MSTVSGPPSSVGRSKDPTLWPPAASTRRRSVVLAAIAVAAVGILIAGALVAWRSWTHPDVFPDTGFALVAAPRPVTSAVTSLPVTWDGTGDPTTVTFHSAQATFATNTAAAHVTFAICQRRLGRVFPTYGSLRQYCTSVTPLTSGATMTYPGHPFAHQCVMATITPTRSGVAVLTNVRFSYALPSHHLPRPITDDVALDVTIPVR